MENWEKVEWVKSLGITGYDLESCQGTASNGKKMTVLFTTINYCPLEPVFENEDKRYIYSHKLILVSGIASDTPLRRYLSDSYDIVKHFKFNDHHKYTALDISRITGATNKWPTALIATTEKDSQRLRNYKKMPETLQKKMFQTPIEVDFLSDHEKEVFEKTLLGALDSFR